MAAQLSSQLIAAGVKRQKRSLLLAGRKGNYGRERKSKNGLPSSYVGAKR